MGEENKIGVLEVTTSSSSDGRVRFMYDFRSPPTDPTVHLQAEAVVQQASIDKFCEAVRATVETSADHQRRLQSFGAVLYRLVFPQTARSVTGLRVALRNWKGPLIVKSDGSAIPWELLHDGDAGDDGEFFGIRFALGRQTADEAAPAGEQLGRVRRALLVCDPTGDLPEIRNQTLRLREFLKGAGIECTLLEGEMATEIAVLPALGGGTHDFFHYAGHVIRGKNGGAGLVLSDGMLVDEALADVLHQAPPAVFLIGCESVNHISGLGRAFQDKGARIVVGTIYEPTDSGARDVAENFYFRLCRGAPAGTALQEAREVASKTSDGSWAAFVLLGDPTARFWPDEPSDQDATGDVHPAETTIVSPLEGSPAARDWWFKRELPGRLDEPASVLIANVLRLAADMGLVTSWHVAVGLLASSGSALAEAARQQGLYPSDLAEIFSTSFGEEPSFDEEQPESGSSIGGIQSAETIEMSNNVTTMLARAAEFAAATGRQMISVGDLESGFVASGGGSAGDMLSLLGIKPESVNGAGDGAGDGAGESKPSPFADDGHLRTDVLHPDALKALTVAKLLSASQGQMVSSLSLLLALGFTSGDLLREVLVEQGRVGRDAAHLLVDEAHTLVLNDFSARSFKALEAAFGRAGDIPFDDLDLTVGLLTQEGSAARGVLAQLGVNSDQLLDALQVKAAHQTRRAQA